MSAWEKQGTKTLLSYSCIKTHVYKYVNVFVTYMLNRSQVMQVIEKLQTTGWVTRFTHVVRIQFLLHNAPTNLFTSVSIVVERSPTGALMPSTTVQSTRLHHFPAALDYSVMTCEVSDHMLSERTAAELITMG